MRGRRWSDYRTRLCGGLRRGSGRRAESDGQRSGIPGSEAAGDFDEVSDSLLLEEAGGDGRAIAAGALDGDGAVAGDFGKTIAEAGEGQVETAVDVA